MKLKIQISLVVLVFTCTMSYAQLSPGDLITGHAHLEGISNCFKCHEIGSKVSDTKCLDCHKTIKSRVDAKKGYHYSREVRNKDCASCHNDHHGRHFKIINFDKDLFDHKLTGYKLEGAHKPIDCKDCHKADNIKNKKLRKKTSTFLGLKTDCLSCHDNYHQKTLSDDCLSCHTMKEFESAEKFDHSKTKFKLRGKHKSTDCIECHKEGVKNGKEFQFFADIPFSNCTSCHEDVHKTSLGNNCTLCHSENTFNELSKRFNHSSTQYPLRGKHTQLACSKCHQDHSRLDLLFQEYEGRDLTKCTTCHDDKHENRFGSDCTSCHTVNSFKQVDDLESFDHSMTKFKLEGKHLTVECKLCHPNNMTEPLPHDECKLCHEDFHNSQFKNENISPDCNTCHSIDGFAPTIYSTEDHSKAAFVLEGAHVATPCIMCHQKEEEKWSFRNIGSKCSECHEDIHLNYLDEKYYPDANCINCHAVNQWNEIAFDHNKTEFELEGKHETTDCKKCHISDSSNDINPNSPIFKVSSLCLECHQDEHHEQFVDDNGVTNCSECHKSDKWKPSLFDHDKTDFKLDGEHVKLDCIECHHETEKNKEIYIVYKIEKFECSDCH